jgi:protein transport protein SEC24
LSSERLERHGIFLLDSHFSQFLWIGSTVHPELLTLLFGEAQVPVGGRQAQLLPELENDWSRRLRAICAHLRSLAHCKPADLFIIREDTEPALKAQFMQYLIEDRVNEATPSYAQWLSEVSAKVTNGSY